MDILLKAANDAVRILNSVRARYKIILPTGEEFGDLMPQSKPQPQMQAPEPLRRIHKHKPRKLKYPMGTRNQYIRPFMETLEIGGVAVIPLNGFPPDLLASSVSSLGWTLWGKGATKTMFNHKTNSVEVLRVL